MSNKRAALYVRVSTDAQTVENQIRELRQVAGRRGWDVAEVYNDAGISGAKGRNGRPGLDSMLKDASRRKFDIVMAWAIDRLGRSLIDLLDNDPTPGSVRRGLVPRPAGHRHDDPDGQARFPSNRRLR